MGFRQLRITLPERGLAGINRLAGKRGAEMAAHLQTGITGEDAALACWAPARVAARIKTTENLQIRMMLPPLESLLCDGDSRDWNTLDGVRFERVGNQEVAVFSLYSSGSTPSMFSVPPRG